MSLGMLTGFVLVSIKDADIICLQEMRARPEQIRFELPGYEKYWNPAEKAGYSGTAIITRRNPLQVCHELPDKSLNGEGRLITAEFENFFLVNCYSPTSGADFSRLSFRMQWDIALRNYLVSLDREKPVILCGDLNVVHTDRDLSSLPPNELYFPGYTPEERIAFNQLLESGFVDAFRFAYPYASGQFTWRSPSKSAGLRLDYFVVSNKLLENLVEVEILGEIHGSDHCPVSMILKL